MSTRRQEEARKCVTLADNYVQSGQLELPFVISSPRVAEPLVSAQILAFPSKPAIVGLRENAEALRKILEYADSLVQ